MKVTDLLGKSRKGYRLRKRKLITALLASLIFGLLILVVVFANLSGRSLIYVDSSAKGKGIELLANKEDEKGTTRIQMDPLSDVLPMRESQILYEEAMKQDGLFIEEGYPNYIAYTFYVKNTGYETINLIYRVQFVDVTHQFDEAVMMKVIIQNSVQVIDSHYFVSTQMLESDDVKDKNLKNVVYDFGKKIDLPSLIRSMSHVPCILLKYGGSKKYTHHLNKRYENKAIIALFFYV